jgi:superfamily II DNA/RNA helicase
MRPENKSRKLLGVTRSKAKMFEYSVPLSEHIEIYEDPAKLFTLAIGILGDLAGQSERKAAPELVQDLRSTLQFSARFFDAYLQSRLNAELDKYLMLLGASSYYLCDLPGSAAVLARRIGTESLDLGGGGLEELLRWVLQADYSSAPQSANEEYDELTVGIVKQLRQFYIDGNGIDELLTSCVELRRHAYSGGTPRQLLLADIVAAVIRHKYNNSTWVALPQYTDLPVERWRSALSKQGFIRELWPAQHLLGKSGVLRGKSAIAQMPTSAGKTKATELILRSAFLGERTSLAVIVAPFRALCQEIKDSLKLAFRGEQIAVDELSDVAQGDFSVAELIGGKQVLVVTPEKLVYVLRHTPELASHIGLMIFDEGHQFDSGTRGITYELLLTSLKGVLPQNVQKVLVSAVISNAKAVGDWLNGAEGTAISGTTLIPTFRTVAFASWTDTLGRLEFVSEDDPNERDFYVPRVIESIPLEKKPRELKDRVFPEKGDGPSIALWFGVKLVSNGAAAIFCGRKDTAANLCARAVDVFERNPGIQPPSAHSDSVEVAKLAFLHEKNLGNAASTRGAKLGIFCHHGSTPHGIRLAVEYAMREDLAKLVICTSTLAQGVNLPIRYLIVTSVYQGADRIRVRDFHNLIGRAGRAGMHTEGSIIFGDSELYDQRLSDGAWKWGLVSDLLKPSNSEPCASTLLTFFEPIKNDKGNVQISWDLMELARLYTKKPESIATLPEEIAKHFGKSGFTANNVQDQLKWKLGIIASLESFLMSHWDETWETTANVVDLVKGTLAFHLAGDQDKQRLIELFTLVAENISLRVTDPQRRAVLGKTLYGVRDGLEIEKWVVDNKDELLAAENTDSIIDVLWPLMRAHIDNNLFRKCSEPDALKGLAKEWVAGDAFSALLKQLHDAGAKMIWGKTFRDYSIEHAVDLCEGGISFDGSLLIGAVTGLLAHVDSDGTRELRTRLDRVQKMMRYGLPSDSAILLYEAGFSDRAVATELASLIGLEHSARHAVLRSLREKSAPASVLLEQYPSYFTAVFNNLI